MMKCVIFDLDGTLTLSDEGIWNCVRYAAEKMNYPIPDDETLKKFVGPPLAYSFMEYMGMNEATAIQAVEKYRERYNVTGLFENKIITGIRTLLRGLKSQGYYLAIATGKPENPSKRIAEHFGIAKFFDKIVGPDPDDHHAEKSRLIKRALPEDWEKYEIWMVGDRKFDVEGGIEAGVNTIGVGFGYGSEEELTTAGSAAAAKNLIFKYAPTVEQLWNILMPVNAKKPKGFFISMEGMDGSGKSTQLTYLKKNLSQYGFDIVSSREPGGCHVSEEIRQIILDMANIDMTPMCEAYLYAAARAQHVETVIVPAILSGKDVVCDRFVDSSVVYQGAGRKLGADKIAHLNSFAINGTMPDVTVYLDINHTKSLARRHAATSPDRLEIEQDDFYGRVEQEYHRIIGSDPDRFVVVDAANTPEKVAEDVWKGVSAKLFSLE